MPTATNNTNFIVTFNMQKRDLIYKDLSFKINGICYKIQNKLGTKFQEKHYHRALCTLLNKEHIPYQSEAIIIVKFENEILGKFRADIIIDNKILIELKTTNYLTTDHKLQMIRYLKATDLRLGLLINFRIRPIQIWRVVN